MFAVRIVLFLGKTRRPTPFPQVLASATDFLGKYSQMTTAISSTCSEGCAEDGRIKAVQRGEEKQRFVGQDAKGQVRACGCGDFGER